MTLMAFFFFLKILSCQEGDWENCFKMLLFSVEVRGKSSLNVQDTKLTAQWPFQVLDLEDSDPDPSAGFGP